MSLKKSVIVVGAGVKGLFISRELCKIGYLVTILERLRTPGGKIKTLHSKENRDGSYAEMGAMRILESNNHTLSLFRELNINLAPFIEDNDEAPFSIKSQHGINKNLNLGVLMDAGLVEKSDVEKDGTFDRHTSWREVLDAAFETVDEMMQSKGNGNSLRILEFLSIPGDGSFARKCAKIILDLKFGESGPHNVATVNEYLKLKKLNSAKSFGVDGGFDNAIFQLLKDLTKFKVDVHFNSQVVSVDYRDKENLNVSYKIIGLDEPEINLKSDAVVFACPSLNEISFYPDLPLPHHDIIYQTLYSGCTPAVKSVLKFDNCFWQKISNGKLLGGTCWVGPSVVNQIILPSSKCTDDGYLMVYLMGGSAIEWLKYSVEDRIEYSLKAVEDLFPSLKDSIRKHFQDLSEVAWDEKGSGAYYLNNPECIRDALVPVSRLVFSPVPRAWINDALIDGEIAISQVKSILG